MKKYVSYLPCAAALAGVAGAFLRRALLTTGMDEKGLFPANHPGWIGYLLLTVAVAVALWFVTKKADECPQQDNAIFCRILPALGHVFMACGMAAFSIPLLGDSQTMSLLICWGGFACSALLLWLSGLEFYGKRPFTVTLLAPCVYLGLMLFLLVRECGSEPELHRFLPQVAAISISLLARCQLWGVIVDCSSRRKQLFLCLLAGYLCLAAVPGNSLLYLGLGIGHLLTLFPQKFPEEQPEEQPAEAEEAEN